MYSQLLTTVFEIEARERREKHRQQQIERQRRELLGQEQQQTEQPLPQINPDMASEGTQGGWRL